MSAQSETVTAQRGLERERVVPPGLLSGLLVAGTTVCVLLGALYLQHRRRAWPFSLHHGLTATSAGGAASSKTPEQAGPALGAIPRGAITLDRQRAALFGIRTEPVRREVITRTVRAVAAIVPDESRVSHVHTRVAGWIEKLYVATTGQPVRAGAPLAELFSQELLATQSEYLAARADGTESSFADAARARLEVLGFTGSQIAALERRGAPARTVTVVAPRGGVVLRRGVAVGTAVDPSTEIMTVGDLSRVWAVAEIPESDISGVAVGAHARLSFPASGLPALDGKVVFLAPTLSERTRTLRARFELDNRDGKLRPGLFGTVELHSDAREALTVPRDAVVDTGGQQLVFHAGGTGDFEPMPVELGVRLGDRVEVRAGLSEGQRVVSSGVFLVDSESRLRASGGAGTGHSHGQSHTPAPASVPQSPPGKATGHEGH
jgi:membrane fusion protein, copper/silver efflux system